MKAADHNRKEISGLIGGMLEFKAGLTRFAHAYGYIAQLIDLGDQELENFSAFAKLLGNRLNGVLQEKFDMRGIALTGYDIKLRPEAAAKDEEEDLTLKPFGAGGSPQPGTLPIYIQELIQKLNSLFGQTTPLKDQAAFVNQIALIAQENQVVMAQVEKNPKDQAMKGNLSGAVEAAVARAMTSHASLATLLLKADKQAMGIFTNMIYDMLKHGERIDVERLETV